MNTYFFTFGMGQTLLANSYVRVEAPNEDTARELIHQNFGTKWAFVYSENKFSGQAEKHGLTCLADVTVDEFCNILARRA